MPVMPVKSVPGCLVTIAPSVIGVPVAFWLLPRPHLEAVAFVLGVLPLAVPPLPQAATSDKQPSKAASAAAGRGLRRPMSVRNLVLLSRSPHESGTLPRRRQGG